MVFSSQCQINPLPNKHHTWPDVRKNILKANYNSGMKIADEGPQTEMSDSIKFIDSCYDKLVQLCNPNVYKWLRHWSTDTGLLLNLVV